MDRPKSHGKFSAEQREAVYELKGRGYTNKRCAEILQTDGWGELPPFEINPDHLGRIYRQMKTERDELYGQGFVDLPAKLMTAALHRELARTAAREVGRFDRLQKRGALTVGSIKKMTELARTITVLDKLADQMAVDTPGPSRPNAQASADPWLEEAIGSNGAGATPTPPTRS